MPLDVPTAASRISQLRTNSDGPLSRCDPAFEQATVRHGRAEHEWLRPDEAPGSSFEHGAARVLILPSRCTIATDDLPVEIDLCIRRGTDAALLDILHQLPPGSWMSVDDDWGWPIHDAIGDDREERSRVELPPGRVRITGRLGAGARLSVRLARAGG
ncbi:MAG: hypothetical protein EBZ59_11700 [Planctomycetia bacterium]|nr:hypothetical protein [Planctomycetia bacterium]